MPDNPKPEESWTDDSIMPFGLYRGKKLSQIPDSYLIWLEDQIWLNQYPGLYKYVEKFMACYRKEKRRE